MADWLEAGSAARASARVESGSSGETDVRAPGQDVLGTDCELDVLVQQRGSDRILSDARIEVRTISGGEHPLVSNERWTAGAGGRSVLAVPAGRQEIRAWNEAWQGSTSLELISGERRKVVLEVDPVALVLGRVLDGSTGSPVGGASVWLDKLGRATEVKTDPDGRFVFPHLPASGVVQVLQVSASGRGMESVQILARPDGSWVSQLPWLAGSGDRPPRVQGPKPQPPPAEERRIHPARDQESGRMHGDLPPVLVMDVELERERTLIGRIVDEGGAPIEAALVEALGHYLMRPGMAFPDRGVTRSDSSGRFEITGLRSDVSHQVDVSSMGREARLFVVSCSPQATHDCGTLVLGPELVIRGKVLDAESIAVEGIEVRAVAIERPAAENADPTAWPRDVGYVAPLSSTTRTDAAGGFELPGLAAGPWTLTVEGDGRTWATKAVVAETGGVPSVELRLPEAAGVMAGRVWTAGSKASGVLVEARRRGFRRGVTTDAHGSFRFAALSEGSTYTISCSTWSPGAKRWEEGAIEVEAGKETLVDLRMAPQTDTGP